MSRLTAWRLFGLLTSQDPTTDGQSVRRDRVEVVVEVVMVWAKEEDGGDEYSLPCADAGTSVAMAAAAATREF